MTNQATTDATPSVINEAVVNPKTGRPAGSRQGVLLIIGSCFPILGAVLLAPMLPTLSEVFKDAPGSAALVPLILTIPALFIAILSPFAGTVVDKFGRKRVLITALFAYAVVGTMPLYLDSLGAVVASRAAVGVTEAFIMTCCTTLIGDYFVGNRRNKYLGLQALVTALAATVFFAVGGAVGAFGWQTPFWLYATSIIVAVLMIGAIWPTHTSKTGDELHIAKLAKLPWRKLALPAIVAFFGGIVFYTLIVELPYILVEQGVTETPIIGAVTAVASLATAIGAFVFRFIAKRGVKFLIPFSLAAAGLGQVVVGVGVGVPIVILGAVISGFGAGVLLPTLVTWSIAILDYDQRGRGAGLYTGAFFFGEFLTPLVLLGISSSTGLGAAIAIVGTFAIILCLAVAIIVRRLPQPALAV